MEISGRKFRSKVVSERTKAQGGVRPAVEILVPHQP